jgi:dTDP-glucose 4,6-dehydratase
MSAILVTGGAGFIGSHLVHLLMRERSHHVVVLDSLTVAANAADLADLVQHDRYTFVRGDIGDRSLLRRMFADFEFDAVVNLAAESYVDRSITDPGIFVSTNIVGTQALLDAARESWRVTTPGPHETPYRDGVRFVQISAAEVYGDMAPENGFGEDAPLSPTTPYAGSKAGADLLALAYHQAFAFPMSIVRCSINYGPRQFPEKLVPKVIDYWSTRRRIPVYGDGQQIRDWLYVDDHCRAILDVLEKGSPGEIYNVGGNSEYTNLAVIEAVLDRLGAPLDPAEYVRDRPGHARRVVLDSQKITSQLGWTPRLALAEGVRETVDWYLSNPGWLRQITTGAYREYNRGIG